jgi:DNA helicase-2/ATP-dependent DNA helicase PcrA
VAITRAREKLFITSALKRKRGKTLIDCEPSPFINEIPPHLLEFYSDSEDEPLSTDDYFALVKDKFAVHESESPPLPAEKLSKN